MIPSRGALQASLFSLLVFTFLHFQAKAQVCNYNQLPSNLQNGLVAWYPFCNNANDVSGNGLHATANTGTFVTDRFGQASSALSLNGSGQRLDLPINNSYNRDSFSFVFWTKPNSDIDPHNQIQLGSIGSSLRWSVSWAPGFMRYYPMTCAGGYAASGAMTGTGLPLSAWSHVAVIVEGTTVKFYKNGVYLGQQTGASPLTCFNLGMKLYVGCDVGGGSLEYYAGLFDDLFFFSRAITACEVFQLYSATAGAIPLSISNYNPLSDTTRQCGTSKILDAGSGYSSYLWNTGATTQTITATTGGFYKVTVTNAAGCTGSDSTLLSLVNANIIQNDTTICKGSSITLCIDSLFPGRTACNASQLPANLRNGLVAYYPFCDNANDMSGNGNNGTVSGSTLSADRFGLIASAYSFNGIANNISAANAPQINPSNLSVGVWVRPFSFGPSEQYIINKSFDVNGANSQRNWGIRLSSTGTLTLEVKINGQYYIINDSQAGRISLNTWNFIIFTFDGTTVKLFCNNVLAISQSIAGTLTSQAYALNIGYLPHNSIPPYGYFWNGQIDDIFIYDRALSLSEIGQLYTYRPSVSWSPTSATTNCITVSPTQTTRYYVTVTDGITTCMDSVLVSIAAVDTSLNVLDPAQLCATGGAVRFRAGVASSYQWLKNGSPIAGATSQNYSATTTGSYRVALTNGQGCRDTSRIVTITIAPQPVAGFSTNAIAQCLSGNNFFFTNNSTISSGTLSYRWDLGDGTILATANASHVYTATGNYTVKLVVTSNAGCADSTIQVITVNAMPVAGFSINTAIQCINNNSFQFTNTSTIGGGNLSALWNFGDGFTANTINAGHTYAVSGTYSVKLVVTSTTGCKDSIVRTVTVNPKPSVSFSVSPSAQCVAGNSFVFTNGSTVSSGTLSYFWKFGDGATGTNTNEAHTYAAGGTYMVWLIATTNNGCKDSSSRIVTVNPQPLASFTINNGSQCINGNSFIFTSNSSILSGSFNCFWYFGDGGTANTSTATHTYLAAGTYAVKLVVTSNFGCRDSITQSVVIFPKPSVGFTVNNAAQCLNGNNFLFSNTSSIVSGTLGYYWDFGDGGNASTTNAAHTYSADGSFIVKLVAISNNGCRDSSAMLVTVYPKPVPGFTVNASRQCFTGNNFQFTNSSQINNGTMNYFWDFGDGVNAASMHATHSYAAPGNYTVKLVASSNNGCIDSVTRVVIVDPSPAANFSVNQVTQCFDNNRFVFSNSSTLTGGTMQFLWDFGDGTGSSSQQNPVYSYRSPGIYTVTLTCVSNFNCNSTMAMQVIVRPTPAGTIFNPGSTVICEGGFINLTVTGGDSYQWLLNGNPISGAVSANFVATDAGNYGVVLTNSYGCAALASNSVTLTKVFQPTVDFSFDKYCVGEQTNFLNLTDTSRSGRVSYVWDFGDTSYAYTRDAFHIYRNQGTYSVRLTVTPLDCPNLAASISRNISFQLPPVSVRYPSVNAVSGKDLALQARAFNGASYNWQPATGLSAANLKDPVFRSASQQQYIIRIQTADGCKVNDTLLVRIFAAREIYVPDVFSPNGDGKNDKLTPLLVGITELKAFRIYDRWGQLMFQTNRAGEGWDGSFRSQKQPMETYTWIVEARDQDGQFYQKRGSSILIR